VGFRPFVCSLATSLGLVGNDTGGVFAEVEGDAAAVRRFLVLLEQHAPPLARIERVTRYCRRASVGSAHAYAPIRMCTPALMADPGIP
jgi:hydrogenase maturation factor HypF (carbamoyltransferase family)